MEAEFQRFCSCFKVLVRENREHQRRVRESAQGQRGSEALPGDSACSTAWTQEGWRLRAEAGTLLPEEKQQIRLQLTPPPHTDTRRSFNASPRLPIGFSSILLCLQMRSSSGEAGAASRSSNKPPVALKGSGAYLLLLGMMPFSSSCLSLPTRMASQLPSLPSYRVSTTLKTSPREKARL